MSVRDRELRVCFRADDEAAAQVLRVVEIILSACAASIWTDDKEVVARNEKSAVGPGEKT